MLITQLLTIFYIFDFASTFLGIVLNIFLIYTIKKTSTKRMQKYSYSFLVTSSIDLMVAVVEMWTAHQIKIKNGVLFIMPQGVEKHLPSLIVVFFALHCFVAYMALFTIPAQYKYRYAVMVESANDNSSLRYFKRDVLIATLISVAFGICTCFSVLKAKERNLEEYYLPMLVEDDEILRPLVMYVCDVADPVSYINNYNVMIVGNLAIFITAFYIYKSYKFMNLTTNSTVDISSSTKSMQAQFTRSLVAQTLNTVVFGISPIFMLSLSLMAHLDSRFLGIGILLPFNSMSAINALLTLYLIKAYRRFALEKLGCKRKEEMAREGRSVCPTTAVSFVQH